MKIKNFFFTLLYIYLISLSLKAYSNEEAISIENALVAAINSHPNILLKRNQYESASDALKTAKWQRFPAFSVQTSSGQNSTTNSSIGVITTARIEQPIWTGGKISGGIESAEAKTVFAQNEIIEIEQDLLIKVATSFFDILKWQEKIKATEENLLEHQRLLNLIQRKARSEVSPMSEIILAKSRLEQIQSDKLQMQSQLANAKSSFEQLTGLNFITLKPPNYALNLPESEAQAVKLALEYSPKLKKFSAQAEAADADIKVAKANLYPQLAARVDETYGSAAPGGIAYLSLTYAPGNGLGAFSNIRDAEAKKNAAESTKASTRLDLITSIRSDWTQYESQQLQIEPLNNLIETSRGVYESYVRQYDAGRKTWIEVLNAKKEAVQAKYSLADTQWGSLVAGIRILVLTGNLNSDSLLLTRN